MSKELKTKPTYAVLNWHRITFGYPRAGYYCGGCAGYIGKEPKGQLYCPFCKAKIVGKYA